MIGLGDWVDLFGFLVGLIGFDLIGLFSDDWWIWLDYFFGLIWVFCLGFGFDFFV